MSQEEFKHIIRIVNTDLKGDKPIYMALQKIKGIGFMFSNAICKITGISKEVKAGSLTDAQIEKIDSVIKNPLSYNIPVWMANRRNDFESGQDLHVVIGDLKFAQENDKRRLQKIRSYRGLRHAAKLPVRGQRTKSNFRKNKGKVQGVKRSKEAPAKSEKGAKK